MSDWIVSNKSSTGKTRSVLLGKQEGRIGGVTKHFMKPLKIILFAAALASWLPVSTHAVFFTVIGSFDGTNGAQTRASLVEGTNGNFYGMGYTGGSNDDGTIFEVLPGGVITNLYTFSGGTNSAHPISPLLLGNDGYLYGEMLGGGSVAGSLGYVFQMSQAGVLTNFANFDGLTTGESPSGGLIQGQDGYFYGTCEQSGGDGANFNGCVFRLAADGTVSNLFAFAGTTNGSLPLGGVVQGTDGVLYGTTSQGGTNGNYGTIFKLTTNGVFTSLFSFNKTNGATPYAKLAVGADGNLYGTTEGGGTNAYNGSYGTIFRITPAGQFTSLLSFDGNVGGNPYGGLVCGTNGVLYGTTDGGGSGYGGTIYQITTNGIFTTLYSFNYDDSYNYTAGQYPEDSLIQGTDGNFYGTTTSGGDFNLGTVFGFSLTPAGTAVPVFQSVAEVDGGLAFTWSTVSNANYQVQYTTDLTLLNWINLGSTVTATNTVMSGVDYDDSDNQRFYRVLLLP